MYFDRVAYYKVTRLTGEDEMNLDDDRLIEAAIDEARKADIVGEDCL